MSELTAARQITVKQMEHAKQEVRHHLSMLESFKKYTEEVRDKGSACDVAREANSLHQRARELLEYEVTKRVKVDIKNVKFTSSDLVSDDRGNVVGQLVVQKDCKGQCQLMNSIT
jgi:hypothetical protein